MEKKMTKKEMFTLIATLNASNTEIVNFCNHEIESLDKKKSNGNAKANEKVAREVEIVYDALVQVDRAVSVSELIVESNFDELANEETNIVSIQKVSALLKKLVDSGRVVKFTDKKKSYFKIADNE